MPDNLDGSKYIRIFAAFNKYTWRGWKLCHIKVGHFLCSLLYGLRYIRVSPLAYIIMMYACFPQIGIEQRVAVHAFCCANPKMYNVQKYL